MILIKYIPHQSWNTVPSKLTNYGDQIILSGNNWDDYSFKTSFNMNVVLNNKEYKDWAVRIQIEGESYSAEYLDRLCENGWDGVFPIPNKNYISQFSSMDFYKTLISFLGKNDASQVLINFRDASYMKNIKNDASSLELITKDEFKYSLIRDTGSHKSYEESWLLFSEGVTTGIQDFCLNYLDKNQQLKKIYFKFSKQLLPNDINVLIGANGVGKTYTIKILTDYLLKINKGDIKTVGLNGINPFDKRPNFSKLILTSYSVFENFVVDLSDQNIKSNEKDNYKYFGLRARDKLDSSRIAIGRNIPSLDATKALFNMINEDSQFNSLDWWVNKLELAKATLKKAFDFDEFILEADGLINPDRRHDLISIDDKRYVVIDKKLHDIDKEILIEKLSDKRTISFLKNNKIVELSSGQKIFSYIVLNILGEIKEGSLIIIDEPELFLHPTLEIEFIGLLKLILAPFKSKAILATHSLSIVREVPANCVHIYKESDLGLNIENPPFQTFGGDMQRISTYVFGDSLLKKPYEDFIKDLLETGKYKPDELISELSQNINEEMIMDIKIWESMNNGN